jgi:DNA invertase Pin-like site-specific DNA recombinase
MLIGYARVSPRDPEPHLQMDALREAGCERIFEETASGAKRDRPELKAALDFLRSSDSLVVWKLDRLARSTRQLLETVGALEQITAHRADQCLHSAYICRHRRAVAPNAVPTRRTSL